MIETPRQQTNNGSAQKTAARFDGVLFSLILRHKQTIHQTQRKQSYMDKIEIFLKYHGEPHTTPPHNDNNPDGTDNSDRGFLITEFLTTNLTSSEYYT